MSKKKKKSDIIIGIFIIGLVIAFVVVLVWKVWGLFNGSNNQTTQETVKQGEVDKIIGRNLDMRYPETPSAVVKLYCSIAKELHTLETEFTQEITEEQVEGLLKQLRKLFDDELLDNNSYEEHLSTLVKERKQYKKSKMGITRYVVDDSNITIYSDEDNQDCTKVNISYTIKVGSEWKRSNEQVILRKDQEGRWKILGTLQLDDTVVVNGDEE